MDIALSLGAIICIIIGVALGRALVVVTSALIERERRDDALRWRNEL